MKISELLAEQDLRAQAQAILQKQGGAVQSSSNTQEKELVRTKEIFSKIKTFDNRIRSYTYDPSSKTLVLYGAWPQGPGYDGNNVARGWAVEFDPRIVKFVQLWSLDGKVKYGSTLNNNKPRF